MGYFSGLCTCVFSIGLLIFHTETRANWDPKTQRSAVLWHLWCGYCFWSHLLPFSWCPLFFLFVLLSFFLSFYQSFKDTWMKKGHYSLMSLGGIILPLNSVTAPTLLNTHPVAQTQTHSQAHKHVRMHTHVLTHQPSMLRGNQSCLGNNSSEWGVSE